MPANHELTHGTVGPPSGSQTRAVYTGSIQWVWFPATLVKTVKVRRGLHDHVGSDRRLVVGQVASCFVVPSRRKELHKAWCSQPTTGRYRLVHRWVLCCVPRGEQTQGLMYSQATVRGKFSRAVLVAKWCHALT